MSDGDFVRARFIPLSVEGNEFQLNRDKEVVCQFNPQELATSKGAQYAEISIPGLDTPILQFVGGSSEQMSLDLFFDTTDEVGAEGVRPVTEKTNEFFELVKMSGREHAPPRLLFQWGKQFPGVWHGSDGGMSNREGFPCVVENVEQTFTYFAGDGTPLRARLSVTLREFNPLASQLEGLNLQSADHTRTHTVKEGETLPGIAHQAYKSAAKWRVIAAANELMDVRHIEAGTKLLLPPIED